MPRDVKLDHPVLDADGHIVEFMPAVMPFLREALGPKAFEKYAARTHVLREVMTSSGARRRDRTREPQGAWWAMPSKNTLDRATATIPRLLHERLPDIGIDFAVLYTSCAVGAADEDDDLRQGICAGFNEYSAHSYRPYADRMTVAGLVPTNTPDEAIAEVEHCHSLGMKIVEIPHGVLRPIPEPMKNGRMSRYLMPGQTHYWDTYGIDSPYDYEPVWHRIRDLKLVLTAHGGFASPTSAFTSISNFSYNHIGSHSSMMYPLCKSLFFGGLPRRFPDLPIGFLECGVTWAGQLLGDLVEHWERRNADVVGHTDPAALDVDQFMDLIERFGPEFITESSEATRAHLEQMREPDTLPARLDDYALLEISTKTDLAKLFASNFYFGCEADDRGVAFAFSDVHAGGVKLKPVFSSDIGHWDVMDMASVVGEARGLVRKGVLTEEQLAAFTFTNPAEMFQRSNPDFFVGTSVETQVSVLSQ